MQIAQITPRLQSELNSMKYIKSKVVVVCVCVFLKCITYITQKNEEETFTGFAGSAQADIWS